MEGFKEITPDEIQGSVFTMFAKDWLLLTAGSVDSYNTMTAGWGGFGVMWAMNVCAVVVRPQRYTHEFMEANDHFTVSFFGEEHRDALKICGSKSGRNIDKAAEAGLTPISGVLPETTAFSEARLVIECRKIYRQDVDPSCFVDPNIDGTNYPNKDYHRLYIGEIVRCWVK